MIDFGFTESNFGKTIAGCGSGLTDYTLIIFELFILNIAELFPGFDS